VLLLQLFQFLKAAERLYLALRPVVPDTIRAVEHVVLTDPDAKSVSSHKLAKALLFVEVNRA
jgi:hypothetical protein